MPQRQTHLLVENRRQRQRLGPQLDRAHAHAHRIGSLQPMPPLHPAATTAAAAHGDVKAAHHSPPYNLFLILRFAGLKLDPVSAMGTLLRQPGAGVLAVILAWFAAGRFGLSLGLPRECGAAWRLPARRAASNSLRSRSPSCRSRSISRCCRSICCRARSSSWVRTKSIGSGCLLRSRWFPEALIHSTVTEAKVFVQPNLQGPDSIGFQRGKQIPSTLHPSTGQRAQSMRAPAAAPRQ